MINVCNLETGFFLLLLILSNICGSDQNSKLWKEPDAWSRAKVPVHDIIDGSVTQQECKCPILEECDVGDNNQLSTIYYKKILNLLFNLDNFNEAEHGIYTRILQISLNSEQINILKNSKDPRDWDAIVSNVFKNSERKFPNLWPSNDNFIIITLNWLKTTLINFFSMPQFSFLCCTLSFILTIIYLNRRYNYGIIAIFLVLCFLSGYAYTYYECNKQLEIEQLAALLESEGDDPCENIESDKKSWSIWNLFSSQSTKAQCMEHLKKKHKTKLPFCRPDEVFLVYGNEIILTQFQRIIEKCTDIFKTTLATVPFPYNLIAILIFGLMLPLFLKMLFQHIFDPRVWFHKSSNNMPTPTVIIENTGNELVNKLLLEKLEYHQKKTDAKLLNLERSISGVQILEPLENVQKNIILESSESNGEILNTTEILATSKSIQNENSLNLQVDDTEKTKSLKAN